MSIEFIICPSTLPESNLTSLFQLSSFGLHGIGGIAGAFLTGIFADTAVTELGGYSIKGGWMNGNWVQPFKQLTGVVAMGPWSFVVTYGLLFVIDKIPGMKIRLNAEAEELGSDREP